MLYVSKPNRYFYNSTKMNLQIAYSEIKKILSKTVKEGISIEEIEYVDENTFNLTIQKSVCLKDVLVKAHICVVSFYGHNIVVDVKLDGLARVWQKIASIKWINESHLEWLLREIFNLEGLVSIDENNRDRLTIHLDRIKALTSTLELLEFERISFNEMGFVLNAETL